jgi:hypothetical protein
MSQVAVAARRRIGEILAELDIVDDDQIDEEDEPICISLRPG